MEHQREIQLKLKRGGLFSIYMCKTLDSLVSSKIFLTRIFASRWWLESKCFFLTLSNFHQNNRINIKIGKNLKHHQKRGVLSADEGVRLSEERKQMGLS